MLHQSSAHDDVSANYRNHAFAALFSLFFQFIEPWVVVDASDHPVGPVVDGDAVVTFNFRADRMLEMSTALEWDDAKFKNKFGRGTVPDIRFAGMMQYDGELKLPSHYLVPPPVIKNVSEEYLVLGGGVRVFACSESQKIGVSASHAGYMLRLWQPEHAAAT